MIQGYNQDTMSDKGSPGAQNFCHAALNDRQKYSPGPTILPLQDFQRQYLCLIKPHLRVKLPWHTSQSCWHRCSPGSMVEPEHVNKQRQRVQRAKVQLAELMGPMEAQSQESGAPRRAGWRAGGGASFRDQELPWPRSQTGHVH